MLRPLIILLILFFSIYLTSQAQQTVAVPSNQMVENILTGDEASDKSINEAQDQTEERPVAARLHQNFPNPFNPVTTIAYRLPENSTARIEVFDQLGRSVDIILNESRSAGEHDLMYDASHLPSGVYIYRMEMQSLESSNRQVFTRKFTLIK